MWRLKAVAVTGRDCGTPINEYDVYNNSIARGGNTSRSGVAKDQIQ